MGFSISFGMDWYGMGDWCIDALDALVATTEQWQSFHIGIHESSRSIFSWHRDV